MTKDPWKRQRQIRAEMVRRGLTAAEIGRQVGVTRSCVSHVVAGRWRNAQVEEALMAAGVPARLFAHKEEQK